MVKICSAERIGLKEYTTEVLGLRIQQILRSGFFRKKPRDCIYSRDTQK